jgi:hypothetical protein
MTRLPSPRDAAPRSARAETLETYLGVIFFGLLLVLALLTPGDGGVQ